MTMNSNDAQYLYDLGRELNLFVGEGMWTRFFPAVEWTRCHFGGENDTKNAGIAPMGQVRVVHADFSIDGTDVGPFPTDSLFAKELGGGSAWCVMPYIVAASIMPFENTKPEKIAANGVLPNEDDRAGDLAMGVIMTFNNNSKNASSEVAEAASSHPPVDKSISSGVCGYLAESCEVTTYAARGGRITINAPAHCPTSSTIVRKCVGRRGNGETTAPSASGDGHTTTASNENNENGSHTVHFPLPQSTPEIEASGGIKMPNSMGFIYEAEAARRLIAAGQISFPQWTPGESVECIRIIEEMLRQVNE